jgi:cardiolipin synthase (CMP-forming)
MASRILTVPNQLTLLRLAFLPFFVISILYERYEWALAILIAAAASDGLDGLLARKLHQKTALGAYLDPIADKLLLSSSFFLLALKGKIGWWLAILVLSRDVLILAVAVVVLTTAGPRRFPPSLFGKATTLFQILLIAVVIAAAVFARPEFESVQAVLIYAVAALTIISGLHYAVLTARRVHSSA